MCADCLQYCGVFGGVSYWSVADDEEEAYVSVLYRGLEPGFLKDSMMGVDHGILVVSCEVKEEAKGSYTNLLVFCGEFTKTISKGNEISRLGVVNVNV